MEESISSKIRNLFFGTLIGILVGLMISIFRLLVVFLQGKVKLIYEFGRQSILQGFVVICIIFIFGIIVGYDPVIDIGSFDAIHLRYYPFLIIFGILIGLISPLFTKGINYMKRIYNSLNIPVYLKVAIPFVITATMILYRADLFGSGEPFIFLSIGDNLDIYHIIVLLIIKLVLLILAFSSGMPGGIFLPMLVLGSLMGNIFGKILVSLRIGSSEFVVLFSALGMCANFTAVVRSPLTSIMLLLELTGSFSYFLPISVAVLSAYMVAELLKLQPVYEMLLDLQLEK